ncbi:MAG: VPLPA-CTERM sorting domain-containing protein, partial [Boseongicola sp.]
TFGYIATGYGGTNSAFELILNSNGDGTISAGDMRVLSDGDAFNPDLSGLDLVSDVFGVMAGEYGSWKLWAVTVDYTPPEIIPLPAAVWLMLGGLGGLVTIGRRRQKAT